MLSNNEYGTKNLRLLFPGMKEAFLKNLDFSYTSGEKILVLGPSGAGKSTLLEVLAGLIPTIIDVPAKWDDLRVPDNTAYFFQDPDAQFNMPYTDEEIAFVFENQQIPSAEMPERIAHYMALANVTTDTHTAINKLSGGMKQRLQLASLLALKSDFYYLDEPTAMLDPEATQYFWEQMKQLTQQQTVIVVEHKITEIIDYVSRIVIMSEDGSIIADGPTAEILTTHTDYLHDAGIWHPESWTLAPKFERIPIASPENLLTASQFKVKQKKQTVVSLDNLTVQTGDWLCISGENGSGKSTLLEGLRGLLKTSGKLTFPNGSQETTGFVFQNPDYQFVCDTVKEDLAFGLQFEKLTEEAKEERILAYLDYFSLTARQAIHPLSLSMGQKRRLSVASSVITEPQLLLLDEPTFGQDARNTFRLIESLEHWRKKGMAILMITHEPEIIERYATGVINVKDGIATVKGGV